MDLFVDKIEYFNKLKKELTTEELNKFNKEIHTIVFVKTNEYICIEYKNKKYHYNMNDSKYLDFYIDLIKKYKW